MFRIIILCMACTAMVQEACGEETQDYNPLRNAYFGDLHVHTRNSFDAFIFNVRTTPDDAYRYARGEAVDHPAGYKVRLRGRPLDFMAVTDHAEYMGILPALANPIHKLSSLSLADKLISKDMAAVSEAFQTISETLLKGKRMEILNSPETVISAWQEAKKATEKHYQPGKFTTFNGYEYTSAQGGANLHRNVIFKGSNVPDIPFSSLESQNPEDLWAWMDGLRASGIEALAIPHNSNVSDGRMFALSDWAGQPIDKAYSETRMRNEPLVEISQVKGTSETHPTLSPNDEWAGFELFETLIGQTIMGKIPGSYVREAYLNGLEMEEAKGVNPYKFGLIGSSDTHNSASPVEEEHYFGKIGIIDGTPQRRGILPQGRKLTKAQADKKVYSNWSAAGLAGVWAEENTRSSIYQALRRKESFATSGPQIRVRFFVGYDYTDDLLSDPQMIRKAYAGGMPMGGDFVLQGTSSPKFLVWAMRDVNSGWLQRAQIVKGWVEDGKSHEQVFDVACSDGLTPDTVTHRCPDNGAKVDLADCSVSLDKGAVELKSLWVDPTFRDSQRAFYYVRILENPSCRWSDWDQMRTGMKAAKPMQVTTQERAWSSPVWTNPEG